MRHRWLVWWALGVAACGGSSRSEGSDGKGDDGDADRGGSSGVGRGGATGTSGTGTSGSAADAGEGSSRGGTSAGAAGDSTRGGTSSGIGGTTATGGQAGVGAMPPITSCTDEFPFAGEWEGNVLDFFYEPLERVRLSVMEAPFGFVGALIWGEGEPPPAPTSADEPYPPGLELGGIAGARSFEPWPGYPYSVVRGAGCDASFRVSVSVAELWNEWCALQTPLYTEGQGWGCTYRGGGSSDGVTCTVQDGRGNPVAEYPQWRCDLCGWAGPSVCACDESSCTFNPEATDTFDLVLNSSADVLSGPDSRCGDCTVRLERVE